MTFRTPSILDSQAYDFAALRQIWNGRIVQSGILNRGDLALTPKASQPPMGITVAAGEAWIKSTSVAWNGAYHVINDAAVDLLLNAADPTNPRIDRIILRANDTSDLASLTDSATLEALPGTPSVGATLVNLTGAQAQPANSLTLGFVLVAAAATSVAAPAIGGYADPYGTAQGIAASAGALAGAPPPYALGRQADLIPSFVGYHAADQSIPNNTLTALLVNSERQDTDQGHDLVTNTNRYTVKTPGTYLIGAAVTFNSSATGIRTLNLRRNGATLLTDDSVSAASAGFTSITTQKLVRLAVEDYVEMMVNQTSGGALFMRGTLGPQGQEMSALWVAP